LGTVDPPPDTPVVNDGIAEESVVLVVLEVVVPPSTKPPAVLDVAVTVPVTVPSIVPVHTAFDGQHATCPASSRAQFMPDAQHTLSAPRSEHEL
jgi:hypothetical protein